jgi:hypothetical protein
VRKSGKGNSLTLKGYNGPHHLENIFFMASQLIALILSLDQGNEGMREVKESFTQYKSAVEYVDVNRTEMASTLDELRKINAYLKDK